MFAKKKGSAGKKLGTLNRVNRHLREVLAPHDGRVTERVLELLESKDEAIALKAAQMIWDRLHGRPAQAMFVGGSLDMTNYGAAPERPRN